MRGVVGLLGVLFIALKLTGTISWSWTWVLAPFWASALVVMAVLFVALFVDSRIKGRKSW